MATTERTSLHGRPMQGPTTGRPDNAYAGMTYFDETACTMLYYDGNTDEWRPMGVTALGEANMSSGMRAIPGVIHSNGDGDLRMSDGVSEMTFTEEPESSSST